MRVIRPWHKTLLFFCPEISSGISKTISTRVFSGKRVGPFTKTPDWLKFSIVPSFHVPRFFTRYLTGEFILILRARGTHVGLRACGRRRDGEAVASCASCATRSVRFIVAQSYLYSAAHNRQTW